jgi:hypothetical protein
LISHRRCPRPTRGGRRNQRGTTLCLMNLAVSRIHPGGHGQHTAAANFAEFVEVLSRKPLPVLVKLGSGRVCRNPSRPRLRRQVFNRVPLRPKMLYIEALPGQAIPSAATHLSGRKTQRVRTHGLSSSPWRCPIIVVQFQGFRAPLGLDRSAPPRNLLPYA